MQITLRSNGPIFDGRELAARRRMIEGALDAVADQAYSDVMTNLNQSIRQPTPYYETQVTVDRSGADRVVHDRGIIYGPWLEGVGSRNRTTRFKGYFNWRRAKQSARNKVRSVIAPAVARYRQEVG